MVAVWDNALTKRIKNEDSALFNITGSGQTIGTAIYTFDNLPERLSGPPASKVQAVEKGPGRKDSSLFHDGPERIQIESVGRAGEDTELGGDALEMARVAAEECLGRSSHSREEIGLLIHSGVYKNDFLAEPALAAFLAGELKINEDLKSRDQMKTLAFDILNGPMGFLNSCFVATQMVTAGKARAALLTASELENNKEAPGKPLLGLKPTGSALVLSRSGGSGSGFGTFIFKDYVRYLNSFSSYATYEPPEKQGLPYLIFEKDPQLHRYYLECIGDTLEELITSEGIESSQIKVVFPPQISAAFVADLQERLDWRRAHFISLGNQNGDFSSSSLALGFHHAQTQGLCNPGEVGLFISVAPGIQVGAALYYF